ncbi:MAG: bifunctional oligoribonuclease/PAP phosphatase NrnA [Bacilli bacterium]|nr:bifunctional oligoribonuclease/PAP phosphatase NrnA [Bacilli bacterium]
MCKKICKQIFKTIKKYDSIIIARHVGADPDALGSQLGLKNAILDTFQEKKVYAIGNPASKFKYLGDIDKVDDEIISKSLLIITDTPDKKRVDGIDPSKAAYTIKIDHHPFVEKFCDIEWVDDTSCSASQMIIELLFNTPLKITKETASKLYIGIVADTNRFLFSYTTSKTFFLVSRLIEITKLDFTKLYDNLYLRPLKEIKFESYLLSNMKVTENGVGYIKINDEMLTQFDVDAATAGNMVNNFNFIEDFIVWATFSIDKNNGNTIRGSIRSRGPIINTVAQDFKGGGHIYASGVRLKNFEEADKMIEALDKVCLKYKETTNLK